MAVFAYIGGIDMAGILAGRSIAIVATDTGAGNIEVIEAGR
jgi:hypothetical protein